MDVSELLASSPGQHPSQHRHHQQQQIEPLSSEMSLTPTLQQQQTMSVTLSPSPSPSSPSALLPLAPVTPTTPRTTTHTPREIPTMYILEDLYDDDYIDQFNSYNTTTPTEEPDPSVSIQLAPCPICSRTFNPATLRKHVGICEKMATKRRNVFDSSRQRREGTELASYPLPKNFGLPEKASSTNLTRTKSERGHSPNPQQVSSPIMQRKKPTEDFVRSTARTSMRKLSTSSATDSIATTNFARDRLRSSERSLTRRGIQPSPGEQCPHCDRCFGIKAYDRHVEWCKEKALQASIKHQVSSKAEENIAKARLEARTKYKAPCLKTKRSVNRDKYSGFPGDEYEDSPKSQKIGNKANDSSLMSMSMTSSITSERKINKPTGNRINEASSTATTNEPQPAKTSPTTPAAAATSNASNRKRSRDTTTHTPTTSQLKADDLSTDSVAKFEIEMPDLRWVGEQMTTSGANSKIKGKALRGGKEKTNVPVGPAKTTTKTKQQHVISTRSDHKLQADVIHSMAGRNAANVAHKKTPSNLSLKTKRQIHFKESHAAKNNQGGAEIVGTPVRGFDDDHGRNEDEVKESIPRGRKVDFTKSLTFYASPSQESGDKTSIKSFDDEPIKPHIQHASISKMTMEEYFSNGTISNDLDLELALELEPIPRNAMKKSETFDTELQENLILGSKKIISTRKGLKKFPQKTKIHNKDLKREDTSDEIDFRIDESCNIRDVILMRSEELIKPSVSQTNQCYSVESDSMTMVQSYARSSSDDRYKYTGEEEEDDDEIVELGRKSYLDLNALKADSKHIPAKSITKSLFKQKIVKDATERDQATGDQNKRKEKLSNENFKDVKKMVKPEHNSEMKLSRFSTDLSDESYPIASKQKRVSENTSRSSSNRLETNKTVSDEINPSDFETLNSNQTCASHTAKPSPITASSMIKPNLTLVHDHSSCGETDVEDKDLKTSTSKSDTFIKTDSDSEDGFETPPEIKNDISNSPRLNYDELRSLIPNFKAFSPPKRITKARSPPMEDRTSHTCIKNSKEPQPTTISQIEKPNRNITRTLTPRLERSSTPPPISTTSGSLPNTPRSTTSLRSLQIQAKLGTSPIKSLSIYRPQRTKVLRQTVSNTSSTGPMKAIPLTKETIEIYGVSSAPHISQDIKKQQDLENNNEHSDGKKLQVEDDESEEEYDNGAEIENEGICLDDQGIKVIKEPPTPKLERNKSFTVSGLPDNYDPFLSAKRQLEELCSPSDSPTATSQMPLLPSLPCTPAATNANRMSTSFTLGSSTPLTSSPMTTSQTPQTTANPKTPTLARSSSFRRTGSLRGPRRSPLLTQRVPLFAQKHRPTIQRGLSDEGPISTNFLKPEEYDEMPVRSVCVNDYAVTKSPRVVRRDNSASNRKQPLKLNINAANNVGNGSGLTPDIAETESAPNTASRYVSKTDSLAVFLKYETELEKLNKTTNAEIKKDAIDENANPSVPMGGGGTTSTTSTGGQLVNVDGPLNAKELKDKSNNLSKQNSAKNIKAELLEHTGHNEPNENLELNLQNNNSPLSAATNESAPLNRYNSVRLTPLSKPSTPLLTPTTNFTKPSTPVMKPTTPLTKPTTPLTNPTTPLTKPSTPLTKPTTPLTQTITPFNVKSPLMPLEQIKPQKPVALSSLFSEKSGEEHKNSVGSDYIDPKLINKCDNLPVNLNKLRGSVFKTSDSDTSDPRMDHFSSSSSESSAPATKFLPTVNLESKAPNNISVNQNLQQNTPLLTQQSQSQTNHASLSQRNSAEGRNLLKRRMRLGRNQFLYDASPEVDSCSADDEANRSSMECERFIKDQEKAFDRFSATQINPLDAPFIAPSPLPAEFEDFDFEEFLSSFENDEEQFPLFKDCREFLLNRTSKKQRSMLIPNSNVNIAQTKKSTPTNQHTFPPLTPSHHTQHYQQQQQNFQFPNLPQHKGLFESFSLTNRSKNRTLDQYPTPLKSEEKREIFISIETEQNDLDKSSISPNSIRHMVGNPQCVVEVEVDAHSHDNKFSKISDDDEMTEQQHHQTQLGGSSSTCQGSRLAGGKQFCDHRHLPNVQLNNAKNLIQQMQEDFRHLGAEMSANIRQSLEHQRSLVGQGVVGGVDLMSSQRSKAHKATGTPSGDAYADSDELSSLDGYPLSSPNSRLGVSSKTSADSAYGSLSRQRSSELTNQRNTSSRHRPLTSATATGNVTMMNRPLTEERSRQLSASSSSSSEHALPPIGGNSNYQKQQQQQQQQHLSQLYNNNNNNSNSNPNDLLDDMLHYECNNNFDTPIHPNINVGGPTTNATTTPHHSSPHHETTPMSSSTQLYGSTSTMSSSMKMSRFCHECGSRFLLEQAKFCMDCGVKRIVL